MIARIEQDARTIIEILYTMKKKRKPNLIAFVKELFEDIYKQATLLERK